jgi:competence protein ComEA
MKRGLEPIVPRVEGVRLALWLLVAAWLLAGAAPAPLAPIVAVPDASGCRLELGGGGPACDCARLSGAQRLLLGHPLPLASAAPADLEAVPGIGPARARAIVHERERGGGFARAEDLQRVPGIGPATVERLRPWLLAAGADPACAR